MRITIILAVLLGLTACAHDPGIVVRPEHTSTVEVRYVRVPASLTQQHPIAEGPLSACPEVAAARKRELEQCNAHNAETARIEGTRVEAEDR